MSLRDWLRARQPAPPAALLARMEAALGRGDAPDEVLTERALAAAERLLAQILATPSAGRGCALDLLAVDALVTYAFEADSARPERLDERARDAMRRLAALASEPAAVGGAR